MEESSVIKLICDRSGCVEYDDLLQMAGVEDLEIILKNRDVFTVIQQNKSKKVLVTSKIRRCTTPDCQESCTNLHHCKFELLGQCNRHRCKYGHSLESQHNSRVLREHGLRDLSKDQLCVLLLQNDSSLLPNVCVSYNKGSGKFGNCPDEEACTRLHVCEKYLRGLCDGSSECNRCHDMYEPHPAKTLKARGVTSQPTESLLLIYRNILTLKDHRNARDKPGAKSKENHKSSNRAKGAEALQRNAGNVICLSFIRGNCKYGDKCWRVHFGLPYKWEMEVDEVWKAIPNNEVIERDYCDPAKTQSAGEDPVRYDTMTQGVHRVRRLSTGSSVTEHSFSHTTKWIWYWQNEYNNWIEYGSVKEMHRLSSITSDELEKKYLHFLEDDTHDVVKFAAGKQFYELNFRDMKQRNEMSSTERAVRRRPFFVSLFDFRTTSRRGPTSSFHTGVPGFWDKTAIPESGFQRVLLHPSHKDYVKVQELFNKTMKDFNILTIERVQNKELWQDFQTTRERMNKANSHKKYKESQRLLFHGTNAKNVDAICRQNFDMRVSGVNATVYGQGSYFARDAKYSNNYTDHYGERCMFACRVLVGQYVKGESHYRRPPERDAAGNLYDTCVNDVREPTIYVVFKQSQVYPEFLITYEKSRFPNSIQTVQSNRTANVVNDVLDVSQTASVTDTGSHHKANNDITSSSTSTGETSSVSIPTVRNLLYTGLNSPVNPAKEVFMGSRADDTKSLNVVLAPPKSELSVHSKPTQGLTSSSLLKESDQGLSTSPVFSNSDNLLTAAKPSLSDNTVQSGIAKNQQQTLTVCTSNLANERRFVKESLNSPPFRSLALAKSVTDSLDPFSCSSDKAKIFDASPTSCISETESKTSVSSCDRSLSGSLVSFSEIRSSENACQKFKVFDDVTDVVQTPSVISTSSPHKLFSITPSSTSTGETSSVSIPTVRNLLYTGLNSPVNPAKDVFLGSRADGTKSLKVVLAPPKSELSVHSKPTQGLTLSSLLKESDQGLSTSPVFSKSSGDGSLSGSLVCFSEIRSSENASQRFEVFDDVIDVIQTPSVISTGSFRITPGPTSTGEEFLTSKPVQGSTSPSYTGLPRTSAQDSLPSVKIPVSSSNPSLTDRSIHSKLRPNSDLITTQRSQSSEQASQKPAVHRQLVTNFSHPLAMPSSTARARNLNSDASSHSAEKISMMYKTSSSIADKQSRSAGSSSSSSVSFYEIQPSALSSTQTPPKSESPQQASRHKNVPEAQSKREKCVMM